MQFVSQCSTFFVLYRCSWGEDRGSTVLCYKSEGRWFDPSSCQCIFKSFCLHYGPSASNRNEYQEYFLGVKAAGG